MYCTKYWIGCSGFSYKDWVENFYPKDLDPSKFLTYYSSFFNTVEINSTFYKWPRREQIFSWATRSPSVFKFSFKLPRDITHEKKLAYIQKDVKKFLTLLEPVIQRNKLGVILAQLPPSMGVDLKKLENFLVSLPAEIKFAIEFRRKSWLIDETFDVLKTYKVAYVIVDEPLLPPVIKITSTFTYIRFHGHGKKVWYFYKYSEKELLPWAEKIKRLESQVQEIYIYFNNHFRGYAPANALMLKKLLEVHDTNISRQSFLSEFLTQK